MSEGGNEELRVINKPFSLAEETFERERRFDTIVIDIEKDQVIADQYTEILRLKKVITTMKQDLFAEMVTAINKWEQENRA